MSTFLFKKIVDQSVLNAGMTVPKALQYDSLKALGMSLSKGQNTQIQILINGVSYEAKLTSVNYSETYANRETLQIRYSAGSSICQRLNEIFSYSASVLANNEDITIAPQEEYIEVYSSEKGVLEFKCFPAPRASMKEEFFKYLGGESDLSGYQRSYKLVFYKYFFELYNTENEVAAYTLTQRFQKYYIARKNSGLVPDVNADPVIANIENSQPESVYKLILRNPFNAITQKGFFMQKEKNGKAYFSIHPELARSLTTEDIHTIRALVDKKLSFYYSKIDQVTDGPLRKTISRILNDYERAKKEPFTGHQLGTFFRSDVPQTFYQTGLVDKKSYLVTGSVGQGNWATVPWVCIFDRSITTSATKGVYIVYLLSKDCKSLYLTFNQGCTDIRKSHSKKETIKIMRAKANEITSRIDSRGFATDENASLGSGLTELAELYEKGIIFYKEYKRDNIPSEEELQSDLQKMMDIYKEYAGKQVAESPSTWLLTWNPNNWEWTDYLEAIKTTHAGHTYESSWSCTSTRVKPGDVVYLTVLGKQSQNGIIASGIATSEPYIDDHWNTSDSSKNTARFIDINFDWINNYESESVLKQNKLKELFPNQHWSPQGSGISIRDEYVLPLEEEWKKYKVPTGGEEELSVKDTIAHIKNYIAAKGFSYEDGLIENFYLSLKSKPFVILAGTSGTGKTRLVRLFAEACGATTTNGRYKMVPVRPDWSDSSDLFGHVNLNGQFVPGAIIDFVNQAEWDLERPYFLCLDEMNLARVEYYLSDILSVIETRDFTDGTITSAPLVSEGYYGTDEDAANKYGTLRLPENLYIIGTVNMDETTFPFSRKVLDRANTIEFSYVDLMPNFDIPTFDAVPALDLPNRFLKTEYLKLMECAAEKESVAEYCAELKKINNILQKASAHVGYRVRDEIVFYLLNNKNFDLLDENAAMDNELMQKILPRIQGSSLSVKTMLCDLFKLCAGDYDGYQVQSDNISDKMKKVLSDTNHKIKYRHSAEKIELMTRRFEEDGFTSYWL